MRCCIHLSYAICFTQHMPTGRPHDSFFVNIASMFWQWCLVHPVCKKLQQQFHRFFLQAQSSPLLPFITLYSFTSISKQFFSSNLTLHGHHAPTGVTSLFTDFPCLRFFHFSFNFFSCFSCHYFLSFYPSKLRFLSHSFPQLVRFFVFFCIPVFVCFISLISVPLKTVSVILVCVLD